MDFTLQGPLKPHQYTVTRVALYNKPKLILLGTSPNFKALQDLKQSHLSTKKLSGQDFLEVTQGMTKQGHCSELNRLETRDAL